MKALTNYRITLLVASAALAALASQTLTGWLELDFAAVADGQWWRIWTGHLTHYDANHLFWDLLMFVVLGAACEHRHRRAFAPALLVMVAVISAAIGLTCDQVSVYRGLSGLDTALFVWFVADQIRDSIRAGDRVTAALWLAPTAGLIGKLLYEACTGQTLFVDAETFTPLVESHLAGALAGFTCSIATHRYAQPITAKRAVTSPAQTLLSKQGRA